MAEDEGVPAAVESRFVIKLVPCGEPALPWLPSGTVIAIANGTEWPGQAAVKYLAMEWLRSRGLIEP
jgi:hypothetical protein